MKAAPTRFGFAAGRGAGWLGCLLAAALLAANVPSVAHGAPIKAAAKSSGKAPKPAKTGQSYEKFEKEAEAYWQSVVDKRRVRIAKRNNNQPIELDDYVLTQPPLHAGSRPRRPRLPSPPGVPRIPVVADVLKAAAERHGFVPQRPDNEFTFKQAYAKAALAAGITPEQAIRIYAFETGGNGAYDVQAGLTHPSRKARAISPAVGYNQLLITNSIGLLAAHGDRFIETMQRKAAELSVDAKPEMEKRIAATQRMIVFCRSVRYHWVEHDKLAKTTRSGIGVHAALVDVDLGPLLQTQKLVDSIQFAKSKGHTAPLTGAELEMMNLTGDGNGIDLVTMPESMRPLVPTSNFFQRGGYAANPIARRTAVVSALYAALDARMDRASQLPGAVELAAAFAAAAAPQDPPRPAGVLEAIVQ